jgi:hypothetical protein
MMRVVLAALAGVADVGIQQLSTPRIEPAQMVLFLSLSVLAGVVIAGWWATLIAVTCLFVAASVPSGGEDAGGALEVFVGAELAMVQALLIGLGVAAAKLFRAWRHRRRAAPTRRTVGVLDGPLADRRHRGGSPAAHWHTSYRCRR